MGLRRIRLIIDSDFQNVPLIGMAINKLCFLSPLSEKGAFQVEVIFTLSPEELILDICDTGVPMKKETLEQSDIKSLECNATDLQNIAEGGRGLAIIREVMDSVVYKSEDGKNCLTLRKKLTC